MELKDMILSTLAELEDTSVKEQSKVTAELQEEKPAKKQEVLEPKEEPTEIILDDEKQFCESMRERILVLFEDFQSPNNKSIEAKVDLTLNFLEYSLAVLDERLEKLDNR